MQHPYVARRMVKESLLSSSRAATKAPLALLLTVVVFQLVVMGVRLEGLQGNCRGPSVSTEHHPEMDISEQRKQIVSNETVNAAVEDECRFIPAQDLLKNEVYSGAWWQTVTRFLHVNITKIRNQEGASFTPILGVEGGKKDARMPKDFMDFSVEHLSKWWGLAGENAAIYGIGRLQAYTEGAMTSGRVSDMMSSTIAVIPYVDKSTSSIWRQIRITVLTATIASLVRHGVGRVVVVGHFPNDPATLDQAFQLLYHFNMTLGNTELKYIHVDEEDKVSPTDSRRIVNMPREALGRLLLALKGDLSNAQEKEWLGPAGQTWKYVYFTEDDQILNARSIARSAHRSLDEGGVLIPHRLQPIPHPLDLAGVVDNPKRQMLPETFSRVHVIDAESDSCCDTNKRIEASSCGFFWWTCGFGTKHNHSRLESYELFRLVKGTGIVSLAATEQSRKCVPAKNKQGCRDN